MIYLDYHSSHPMLTCVQQTIVGLIKRFGNPSSIHQAGQSLMRDMAEVRELLMTLVGAEDARVIFTSGATEANNWLLFSALTQDMTVLAAQQEHLATLVHIPKKQLCKVNQNGQIDIDYLKKQLLNMPIDKTPLISLMAANNETAIIQPIAEVARLVHAHHGLLHVDGVQGIGRMPLNMYTQGIDYLTLSAHKMGGPPGVGALVVTNTLADVLSSFIKGGGQEYGLRSGTENWLGIIAWGEALKWWINNGESIRQHLYILDEYLANKLSDDQRIIWLGYEQPRVPGCALLSCVGFNSQSLLMQLDLSGVMVSSGSACSSGRIKDSHVLSSMSIPKNQAASTIRVSYGYSTTKEEIDVFIDFYRQALRTRM